MYKLSLQNFERERRLGFNGDLKLLRAHLEVETFSFDFDGGAAEVERDGQASVLAQLHVFGDVDHELAFPADAISDYVEEGKLTARRRRHSSTLQTHKASCNARAMAGRHRWSTTRP